ncbi:acyl-CoA/acyl-ACP dehydrogenase [Streptomyces samsunensis]|uniref:Acyl-CoA/acyl-ACP dehydrogenase n=1 Tax=Streptomyces malaysiensis TaxID=92644 RepID=A0ABX6WE32_STRMQ|nr:MULTISPECIES: acyl-CoA dehydrogenase family protein [Streptomyces]ATL86819.1 acyl-CoA dehydrogenase type 2 [Streptomyces malaysiensis]NUH37633.1 acyl-CoA/acyl-ACP dehydrogenase [Streptomyces samsunensis]QDL69668.1 acyl-CoA dehydrogenase [Streptomyces malaysiensis]QPI59703.1 acyl-CoA/acyl-ACP dehydrogenase [Streptomyces solisilvae]UHH21372.1 acyl-CoA/acyl-ACP dehydrogenase [Streptomyces sp. HNM0561]
MSDSFHDTALTVVNVLRKYAAEVDDRARFPVESFAALRETGLLGLVVPAEYGGGDAGLDAYVDVAQVLGGGCLSTALAWIMHCQQTDAIARFGGPELRERVLPRVARGELYIASVTTERGKGGHLLSAEAPLSVRDGRLRIERDAPVVTGASVAEGFLITMRESADLPARAVSLVYADREALSVTETGEWDTLGMRGTQSLGVRLSGEVAADQVVGGPGGFREVAVESVIPMAHLGWSACWLGAARAALSELVTGVRGPGRRGPDTDSELVRERLARIRIDLELTSGYLHRVQQEVSAARAENRSLGETVVQIHLNTLKVAASELTYQAADRMMQFAGLAAGYSKTSPLPVERTFRDLRAASLNYANDRLLTATGSLMLLDRSVVLG